MRRLVLLFLICVSSLYSMNYMSSSDWKNYLKSDEVVDYPLVFVHGIGGETDHWSKAARLMVGDGFFQMRYYEEDIIYHNYIDQDVDRWIWSVSYYRINVIDESLNGDLTEYAKRLENIIENIKKITKKDKVVLVAHSMGGLVARKYMTLSDKNWNSTYKIVTVGTPNEGVFTSVGIVGQLEDLRRNSSFIKWLNVGWEKRYKRKKWGVVGAVVKDLWINFEKNPYATDFAGVGYIELRSSIPFGEWREAAREFEKSYYGTENFGFRVMVDDNHLGLLYNRWTMESVHWAMKKEKLEKR